MSFTSPEPWTRRIALIAGGFMLLTFVTSIPALFFYEPVLKHVGYVVGAGHDTRVQFGALLEILLIVGNIGTAVALYPVLRRRYEGLAIAYVASRVIESAIIAVGIVSLLALLTLRQDLAGHPGTDAATLVTTGRSLVAVHDATFLLGPAFCAAIGNGIILGNMMYRTGLVPRRLALLGVIGGPVALASATLVLFGVYDQTSAGSFVGTLLEFAWELSLGIYLVAWGFKSVPAATDRTPQAGANGDRRRAAATPA